MYQNGPTRSRKHRPLNGVPMVRTSFIDGEGMTPAERTEAARTWWETMGRFALMSLSAAALATAAGCGGGSAEPSYQVQGAVRAYTSSGPVDVIVVRRTPAVQQ